MAESNVIRTPVLAGRAPAGSAAIITALPPATRFVLRIDPASAASVGAAAGFDLTGSINSVRGEAGHLSVRLGPDEWLLIDAEGDEGAVEAALAGALGEVFHSLVDVSHRNAAIRLDGPDAANVLNAGCPLDLADDAFPPGFATRTILGKSEIVLIRPGDGSGWRVECWRSFAPYVWAFLTEAAR